MALLRQPEASIQSVTLPVQRAAAGGPCSVPVKVRTLDPMTFECEAYGPNSGLTSQECYMGEGGALFECQTDRQCAVRMGAERRRVWQAIQRLAATEEFWAPIAREVCHPEMLLGGMLAHPEADESR